eukprot:Gb_18945 [translate_table: standard]
MMCLCYRSASIAVKLGRAYINLRMASSMAMSLQNKVDAISNISVLPESQMDAVSYRLRKHFSCFDPSKNSPIFMENAGASLCPNVVIDSMANYMRSMYVQPGAGYELSIRATEVVNSAHEFMKTFMNAQEVGEVALGPSTSQILENLSHSYFNVLKEGDEIIVQEANHEANAGPWIKMAKKRGLSVKFWKVNKDFSSSLQSLGELISTRTRIVTVTHVSNVLGEILNLQGLMQLVKEKMGSTKTRVVVDGVAFAPHRAIDVAKWGVDWYVFSTYKVYGPHMAVLFGTHDAFNEIKHEMPNAYFIPANNFSSKFELGCLNHEGCAGILALQQYLQFLAQEEELALNLSSSQKKDGEQKDNSMADLVKDAQKSVSEVKLGNSSKFGRKFVEAAFRTVKLLEEPLQMALVNYLKSRSDVLIVGPAHGDEESRVPTISFVHNKKRSSDITQALLKKGFTIRNGHMYSHRLISTLRSNNLLFNNDVNEGVVRISMLHYNTYSEVCHLISSLNDIM